MKTTIEAIKQGDVSVLFDSLIEEIKKLGYSVSIKNNGGHKVVIWSNKTHFASAPFVENSVEDLRRICEKLKETIFNVENNHPSRHDIIGKSKEELLNRRRYVVLAIAVWKENLNDATPDRVAYNINYFEVELKIIDKELARF